ncbi:amidohydrolase family protein [Geomicrobium sediminis]|uniref:5-methylthioadenosine/S-adenosylhomocysteine deaminase n=1 Tax=Geomicrobium sediminis TaxID=1347788 RepID=A0ABS2PDF4_9BACL|nr:amidohydrolase family protein [Geomicrobium sediminis]MBM7632833.1 5-methylthioadenosine/S-adenosylhomocysteine deaminase [Geomicrobium sediminis]
MTKIDTLITHADLFTMAGEGVGFVDDGAIAIANGKIVEVGVTKDLIQQYSPSETINASGKMVLPGFIDGHMHSYWGTLRGVGQDTKNWMHKGVGPFRKYLDDQAKLAGSKMNLLEGLAAGTTTFADYSTPIHEIAQFFSQLGARARLTSHIREVPDDVQHLLKDGDLYPFDEQKGRESLEENVRLIEEWHGYDDNRITALLGPQGPDFLSERLLETVRQLSVDKNIGIHMHVAQSKRETEQIMNRYGQGSIDFLEERGFLNERLIAAHLTEANDEEIDRLAKAKVSMILCSGSIGVIAGRVPPAAQFIKAGGYVGLGSDQCSGNNCNQMINEMKLTALFNKIIHQDPEVFPAYQVLRMATIEGAHALGIGQDVGSLEPGKKADLQFIDLSHKTMQPVIKEPMRNHIPNLIYSARGNEIERVMVSGKTLYYKGSYTTVDEEKIMYECQQEANRITSKISPEDFAISKNASYMSLCQL